MTDREVYKMCPFCGSDDVATYEMYFGFVTECQNLDCELRPTTGRHGLTKKASIKAWNTRCGEHKPLKAAGKTQPAFDEEYKLPMQREARNGTEYRDNKDLARDASNVS